jgi:hypothetical protein
MDGALLRAIAGTELFPRSNRTLKTENTHNHARSHDREGRPFSSHSPQPHECLDVECLREQVEEIDGGDLVFMSGL